MDYFFPDDDELELLSRNFFFLFYFCDIIVQNEFLVYNTYLPVEMK